MSLSPWAASLRRRLTPHVAQLRRALEGLAGRIRQSVAGTVGRAVADAVTEAVEAALAMPPDPVDYYPSARGGAPPDHAPDWWRDRDSSSWDSRQGGTYEHGDRYSADDPYERDPYDEEDSEPAATPERGGQRPRGRLARSLVAGCRAAAWWLERHPGRFSLAVATGVGVLAGVTAFFSGSALAGVTGAAASALAVLALTDTLRCAAAALGGTP